MTARGWLRRGLWALIVLPACVSLDLGERDEHERTGELGRVWFDGGGCNGSTTLAVGSRQRLTLAPTESHPELPAELAVTSDRPEVITASNSGREVVLEAHERGAADVRVSSGGELYDHLGFDAVPATRVDAAAPATVFAGATHAVVVSEVYGRRDGEELVLLGGGFVEWEPSPSGALGLLRDEHRVALFTAGPPGDALIAGFEPSEGAQLHESALTIVDPAEAVELGAVLGIVIVDDESAEELPLSTELPVGALFQLRVSAATSGGLDVPLSRFDLEISLEGDAALAPVALDGDDAPEGPGFEAVEVGTAELVVTASVVDLSDRFAVTVVEAPPEETR